MQSLDSRRLKSLISQAETPNQVSGFCVGWSEAESRSSEGNMKRQRSEAEYLPEWSKIQDGIVRRTSRTKWGHKLCAINGKTMSFDVSTMTALRRRVNFHRSIPRTKWTLLSWAKLILSYHDSALLRRCRVIENYFCALEYRLIFYEFIIIFCKNFTFRNQLYIIFF